MVYVYWIVIKHVCVSFHSLRKIWTMSRPRCDIPSTGAHVSPEIYFSDMHLESTTLCSKQIMLMYVT